jgi:4-amino-4-deoxy-L-arabinose transferase-like glycosyltransferase
MDINAKSVETNNSIKSSLVPIVSVLLFGLLVRILWLVVDPHVIVSDEVAYHQLASNLAHFIGYGVPFWPPGYPLVLSVVYFIFGDSPQVAIIFNLILSIATIFIVIFIARKYFGLWVAILTGVIMAVMPSYILTVSLLRYEILLQFCLGLSFWLSLRAWNWRNILGIALLTALATLMRPLMILWPVLLFLINREHGTLGGRIKKGGITLGISVAFVLPWIVYASLTAGRIVPVALNGGMNLWIGNNPDATGAYMTPPSDYWDAQFDAIAGQKAIAYILGNPSHPLKLLPYKIYYSLNREN